MNDWPDGLFVPLYNEWNRQKLREREGELYDKH